MTDLNYGKIYSLCKSEGAFLYKSDEYASEYAPQVDILLLLCYDISEPKGSGDMDRCLFR